MYVDAPTEFWGLPVQAVTVRISDTTSWASEPVGVASAEELADVCRRAWEDWCAMHRLEDEANQAVRPSRHHPRPENVAFARRYAQSPGPLEVQVAGQGGRSWMRPHILRRWRHATATVTRGPRWFARDPEAWTELFWACQASDCHDRAIGALARWAADTVVDRSDDRHGGAA